MREKAVRFGKTKSLVGIVTEAPNASARDDVPAVIMLNSGILHHVGASRLHVTLARALAPAGYAVFRFDHSGIGDSDARRETLPFEQSAVLDVQEAMDYLGATRGAQRFVLVGLCSGADMTFKVAKVDPRVIGMMQLDAWAYRTVGYWVHHYKARVLKLSVWNRWVRKMLARAFGTSGATNMAASLPGADAVTPEYRRIFPPRDMVAADLQTLLLRGVRFFNVFSGGQEEHFNHRGQHRAAFRALDFRDQVQVEYLPTADHLFTGLEHQRFLVGAMVEWMCRSWPTVSVGPDRVTAHVVSHALSNRSVAVAAPGT